MITFRQLEILRAVLAFGSFRKAAEHLDLSQVSVSEHMRALEQRMGTRLFERTPGGPVELTAAGLRAQESVDDLIAHLQDFVEHVSGTPGKERPIRVALHAFMMRNLTDFVADWNAREEQKLELVSDDSPTRELRRKLATRELDAAFFYALDARDWPASELHAHEVLGIFVHKDHPLVQREPITPADLDGTPAVGLSREKPLRGLIDAALAQVGVRDARHVVETAEFGLILSSLYRGVGYTCMFHASLVEGAQAAGLVEIAFATPLPPLQIRGAVRRGIAHNSATLHAIAQIRERLARPAIHQALH